MTKQRYYSRLNWIGKPLSVIGGLLAIAGIARLIFTEQPGSTARIDLWGLTGAQALLWGVGIFLGSVVLFAVAGIQERLAQIEDRIDLLADAKRPPMN